MGIVTIVYLFDGFMQDWCDNNETLYEHIRSKEEIRALDEKLANLEMSKWINQFDSSL